MDAPELLTVTCSDGANIIARRYRRDGRPRLLLSHGNGFAIDGYLAFWRLLLADYEVVVFDLRNHGRNPLHDVEHHTVAQMARDHGSVLAQVAAAFGERKTAGLFHSISSIAAIIAGELCKTKWDALILYDPPLTAPQGNPLRDGGQGIDDYLANNARLRRHHFDHVEELARDYSARVGRNWVEGAAQDMAQATTRPAEGGGYELSCPGDYEARIYKDNSRTESWLALRSLQQPTFILGADPEAARALAPARVGPAAAAAFGLEHVIVPGTGHVLQVEKPEQCVRETIRFLQRTGL
ncbi:alpha/beta hydrolase [Roseiarcaceae bacterium H3SJ34-1]|uniref:alpha/beta fold hydrolase n=1 Tax=Terripilifer ovatus TaxID=3032367 RepID=UPI003AB94EB2|nr:alpha/beta hydrolase [Roseiarcaceae bacterium H3SJ34-1]